MDMCHGENHWSGSDEELQPWLLPPGRRDESESDEDFELATPKRQSSGVLVRQLLAVALAFVAGIFFAESLPHQEAPQENGWSTGAERQLYYPTVAPRISSTLF